MGLFSRLKGKVSWWRGVGGMAWLPAQLWPGAAAGAEKGGAGSEPGEYAEPLSPTFLTASRRRRMKRKRRQPAPMLSNTSITIHPPTATPAMPARPATSPPPQHSLLQLLPKRQKRQQRR